MLTKKQKYIQSLLLDSNQKYDLGLAVELVKKLANCKFDETVEIVFNLGIDPQKSDQVVKGFVDLPYGSGKVIKVAVVTTYDHLPEAKKSDADVVGSLDLIEDMGKGNIDYDVVVATPDIMLELSKIGRVLGPRKLMPSPKLGTVTNDIIETVKRIKLGQVNLASDKQGILHSVVGKASFSEEKLRGNIVHMITEVNKMKPVSAKGVFIKSVGICSTMGPFIELDVVALLKDK